MGLLLLCGSGSCQNAADATGGRNLTRWPAASTSEGVTISLHAPGRRQPTLALTIRRPDIICIRMNFWSAAHALARGRHWKARDPLRETASRSKRRSRCLAKGRGGSWRAARISIRRRARSRSGKTCSTSTACRRCAASPRRTTTIVIGARTTWTDIVHADLPPAFDALKAAAREVGSSRSRMSAPSPAISATPRRPRMAFRRCWCSTPRSNCVRRRRRGICPCRNSFSATARRRLRPAKW